MNKNSLGSNKYYSSLIPEVSKNKHYWRKCANFLNKVRFNMKPRTFISPDNQKKSTKEYIQKAMVDTKLPDNVKEHLMEGVHSEFGIRL